jgi:hypothetical protein
VETVYAQALNMGPDATAQGLSDAKQTIEGLVV